MSEELIFVILDFAKKQYQVDNVKKVCNCIRSLYNDSSFKCLQEVGPYLLSISSRNRFYSFLGNKVDRRLLGLMIISKAGFDNCWKHFRKFLLVKTEDGQELYFRFYDPHVLKIFLPTCDEKQIIEFFGPVEKFIVEGDNGEEAIEFSHQNGVLKQKVLVVDDLFEKEGVRLLNENVHVDKQ